VLIRPENGVQAKIDDEMCHTEYEKNELVLCFSLDPKIKVLGRLNHKEKASHNVKISLYGEICEL
jgi:hypothetical protein